MITRRETSGWMIGVMFGYSDLILILDIVDQAQPVPRVPHGLGPLEWLAMNSMWEIVIHAVPRHVLAIMDCGPVFPESTKSPSSMHAARKNPQEGLTVGRNPAIPV
jgi:hypothetical protein